MNHKSIQILRTKLDNTDTKIANEVLLDGQPLYNKTSNKLYVGDGTKKISELKYIGQEAWDGFNIENGTGAVLIQTKDQNHSFKVMTDGRAKVQSAPIDDNDVVRKQELDTKLNSSEKSKFVDLTTANQNITALKSFTNGLRVGSGSCSMDFLTMPSPHNYAYIEWQKDYSYYALYLPETEGTFVVRPNILPTSTSLVQLSSTGTPSYKPVSELVDTTSTQTITGKKTWGTKSSSFYTIAEIDSNGLRAETGGKNPNVQVSPESYTRTSLSGSGISLSYKNSGEATEYYSSFALPAYRQGSQGSYYFSIAPYDDPTADSVIVTGTNRKPVWKPLSELEVSVPTRSQVDLLF